MQKQAARVLYRAQIFREGRKMKSLTLNLTEQEMAVLELLAESKGMNKTALMRQALRTYQILDKRICEGARIFFENDKQLRSEIVLT